MPLRCTPFSRSLSLCRVEFVHLIDECGDILGLLLPTKPLAQIRNQRLRSKRLKHLPNSGAHLLLRPFDENAWIKVSLKTDARELPAHVLARYRGIEREHIVPRFTQSWEAVCGAAREDLKKNPISDIWGQGCQTDGRKGVWPKKRKNHQRDFRMAALEFGRNVPERWQRMLFEALLGDEHSHRLKDLEELCTREHLRREVLDHDRLERAKKLG